MWGMGLNNIGQTDALYYEDASFLRISDVSVGYTVPKSRLDKMGIERLRVYGQLINPAYFTKFHGGDPEYNGSAYQDDFPSMTFTMGLNLGF
jgi:hypothetical protein